jgi:hypothetical protein
MFGSRCKMPAGIQGYYVFELGKSHNIDGFYELTNLIDLNDGALPVAKQENSIFRDKKIMDLTASTYPMAGGFWNQ